MIGNKYKDFKTNNIVEILQITTIKDSNEKMVIYLEDNNVYVISFLIFFGSVFDIGKNHMVCRFNLMGKK